MPAVLIAHTSDSMVPKYPKKASKARAEGIVCLEAAVGTDGRVKEVNVIEGDPILAEASLRAIRKWRFYPAQKDGKTVEDRAKIRVDFRLDGEKVKAEVVPNS